MLISKSNFRVLLTFSILLALSPIGIWAYSGFNQYSLLPEDLAGLASEIGSREIDTFESIYLIVTGLSIIVNYVGLFLFKSWARHLNLLLTIMIPLADMIIGDPVILDSIEYGIYTYVAGLEGLIIGLTYFSNVRIYFEHS